MELKEIIAKNMTYFREKSGLNKKQVAEALGVSQPSVTHWENGSNSIDINKLIDLCNLFHCELNDMLTQRNSAKPNVYLNDLEYNHIKKYRKLDKYGKTAVDTLIDIEYGRCTERTSTIIPLPQYSKILYDFPVSAGTGGYLDDSTAKVVQLEIEPPRGTDYILRIAGDSMEPRYHDGDYIYVHRTESLNFGEIGVFVYTGNVYMKEYTPQGLKSLNPNYALIPASEDIRCLGRVLGVVEGEVIK